MERKTMTIQCAMKECIYQEGGMCALAEVEIDSLGLCENAICIEIEKDELEKRKDQARNVLKSRIYNTLKKSPAWEEF